MTEAEVRLRVALDADMLAVKNEVRAVFERHGFVVEDGPDWWSVAWPHGPWSVEMGVRRKPS